MTVEVAMPRLAEQQRSGAAIVGASLGTIFEWYDFFLFAMLAVFFSKLFFPEGNETAGLLATLATFGAGFIVRPAGALIFGALGDRIGRKSTFLITIVLMGGSTAGIGLVPTFAQIGWAAPILLVILRLIQGLSLGGEYGGAATYVAEQSPDSQRGYKTSWLQTTATGGQLLAIAVIIGCQMALGGSDFAAWGWRIPFLLSIILLIISIFLRLRIKESPVFLAMKKAKAESRSPIRETFSPSENLGPLLVAFVICAGQGVILYMAQVYPLFFMLGVLKFDPMTANILLGIALALGIPLVVKFGRLSDRIGRKPLILGGLVIAIFAAFPIYKGMVHWGNPSLERFQASTPVTVFSDECQFRLFVTPNTKLSDCDRAKNFLHRSGLSYESMPGRGSGVIMKIGDTEIPGFDPKRYTEVLKAAGFSPAGDRDNASYLMVGILLTLLTVIASMMFGPLAAFLVEQFPSKIRYTSVSVAFNFGLGWFGGMVPFVISAIGIMYGNVFAGLWYPVAGAIVAVIIGMIFIQDRRKIPISRIEQH